MSRRTDLRERILACTNCGLHRVGNGPVPPRGPFSDVMIIGEAPGRQEDKVGKPFIGQAGQLLWENLKQLDFRTNNLFIANAVSCFPDRTPTMDEIYACRGNLYEQIQLCDPVMILALGLTVNKSLGHDQPMAVMHGKWYPLPWFKNSDDDDIMVMPTYHPAAVLRTRSLMRPWREDLEDFAEGPP